MCVGSGGIFGRAGGWKFVRWRRGVARPTQLEKKANSIKTLPATPTHVLSSTPKKHTHTHTHLHKHAQRSNRQAQ